MHYQRRLNLCDAGNSIKKQITMKLPIKFKPVNQRRFVYHVTRWTENKRRSIARNGLIPQKSGMSNVSLVFANNFPPLWDVLDYWPLAIDHYDFSGSVEYVLSHYDFWQIDTLKVDGYWFIDPWMEGDVNSYTASAQPENYICTNVVIPPTALTLYEFDNYDPDCDFIKKVDPETNLVYSPFNIYFKPSEFRGLKGNIHSTSKNLN